MTWLFLYVDDIIIATDVITEMNNTKLILQERFKMTVGGHLSKFLGIDIIYSRKDARLLMMQSDYIKELLKNHQVNHKQKNSIPMSATADTILDESALLPEENDYRTITGKLTYLANMTRPDITFAVNKLSSKNAKPTIYYMKMIQHLLGYLANTIHFAIQLGGNQVSPICYSDASFCRDPHTTKSISGFVVMNGTGPVNWHSSKQELTATSSCEAEYIAIYEAHCDVMKFRNILTALDFDTSQPTLIYEDNNAVIGILNEVVNEKKSKFFLVKYHRTKEMVKKKYIDVQYINTTQNIADMFTKPLPKESFIKFRNMLGMIEVISTEHLPTIQTGIELMKDEREY